MVATCNVCGSKNIHLHLILHRDEKEWGIYQCEYCSTQFVYPQPNNKAEELYDDYYSKHGLKDLINPHYGVLSFPRQWGIIQSLVKKRDARLLDFGCGGGHFLSRAPRRWGKCGIEISEKARNVAQKKGLGVYASIDNVNHWDDYFDVVTMFAVIEHLTNPRETVERLGKMLKAGGLFVIMTGDVSSVKARIWGKKWSLYAPPGHLFYFTADSLDLLMETIGFKKIKHLYTDGGATRILTVPLNLGLRIGVEVYHRIPHLNRLPLFDCYYGYYRKEK